MTSGAHPDGELGEVFLKLGKQGSTLAGVMDAFSIAVSIGLQYGVPLETYASKFTNLSFEPAGLTDDADVRMAKSIMDYIFRRLALDYLDFETRQSLGIYSADERQRYLETGSYEPLQISEAESLKADPPVDATIVEDTDVSAHVEPAGRGRAVVEEEPSGPSRDRRSQARPQGGPHLRRAPREDHRHRRRLAPVHDVRHEDAPRRFVLRVRGVRKYQRLQLTQEPRGGVPVSLRDTGHYSRLPRRPSRRSRSSIRTSSRSRRHGVNVATRVPPSLLRISTRPDAPGPLALASAGGAGQRGHHRAGGVP